MINTEKAFFDTNIFIYALERDMEEAKHALEEAILSDSAVTSTITIMEYSAGIYKKTGDEGIAVFQNFIRDNYIYVCSIDSATAITAAKLKVQNPFLKSADALQLASALEEGCNVFYTNDKRLKKIEGVKLEIRMA